MLTASCTSKPLMSWAFYFCSPAPPTTLKHCKPAKLQPGVSPHPQSTSTAKEEHSSCRQELQGNTASATQVHWCETVDLLAHHVHGKDNTNRNASPQHMNIPMQPARATASPAVHIQKDMPSHHGAAGPTRKPGRWNTKEQATPACRKADKHKGRSVAFMPHAAPT